MNSAIRVENLGKKYTIRHERRKGRGSLAETLGDGLRDAGRRLLAPVGLAEAPPSRATREEFWALRDVSFEVNEGEVVGVIGRNGAGKSTLLKVLSRITDPSVGSARIEGRVASLLEVGTGFNPELTGRENIYLNGCILGMSRREIDRKFDAIVEFSEIEKFLDTPVKRYSSGMYVRLAFAVAAHLDPEILIVDEVLAVGDVAFQNKCLGRMKRAAGEGRTVLFVSHNMSAVQKLCSRAVVLKDGRVALDSDADEGVRFYLSQSGGSDQSAVVDVSRLEGPGRRGSGEVRFTRFELSRLDGRHASEYMFGEPMNIKMLLISTQFYNQLTLGFSFIHADGSEVHGSTANDGLGEIDMLPGMNEFSCVVDPMLLTPGLYTLRAAVFKMGKQYDHIDDVLSFRVDTSTYNAKLSPHGHYVGYVFKKYQWNRN